MIFNHYIGESKHNLEAISENKNAKSVSSNFELRKEYFNSLNNDEESSILFKSIKEDNL